MFAASQLCAGASEEQRARWKIGRPEEYAYLNQSGCMTLTDVLDEDEVLNVFLWLKTSLCRHL
jgi:myosin heavy subunit